MRSSEPTLQSIEDDEGTESREKRMMIWIVILTGLRIGAVYGIISANSSVSDVLNVKTEIIKY